MFAYRKFKISKLALSLILLFTIVASSFSAESPADSNKPTVADSNKPTRPTRPGRLSREERNKRRQSAPYAITMKLLQQCKAKRNLVYATNHETRQKLDIYVPKKATVPMPVVVWIHSGAWKSGSKAMCKALPLIEHGFVVASINYRLTDTSIFPTQIHDCKAAIRYIRANAADYNIDPNRIGVWGSSAGGHLAAMLGVSNSNKELEGKVGNNLETSSNVQAVCSWAGPSDFFTMPIGKREEFKDKDPELEALGGTLKEKADLAKLCSPITHVDANSVPFLLMHGTEDKLVPIQQARLLDKKLKAVNVSSKLVMLEGIGHNIRPNEDIIKQIVEFFETELVKNID